MTSTKNIWTRPGVSCRRLSSSKPRIRYKYRFGRCVSMVTLEEAGGTKTRRAGEGKNGCNKNKKTSFELKKKNDTSKTIFTVFGV